MQRNSGSSPRWPPDETLTPRYTRKAQALGAAGFADKALSERWRSADKAQKVRTQAENAPSRTGLGILIQSRKPRRFPILSGPT